MARAAGSREADPELNRRLRELPSVEALAGRLADLPRARGVEAARAAIAAARDAVLAGAEPPPLDALEAAAREEARRNPARQSEWAFLLLHLREFADPGGTLPIEFDGLVRESFGTLLDRLERG